MPARTHAAGDRLPVHAVHPITGGIAPTIDPIQVLVILSLFIGVYTALYRNILNTPRAAVSVLTPVARIRVPVTPDTSPNERAWRGLA